MAGITASAVEAGHNATTDVNGFFSLELRDGTKPGDAVRIHIEKQGYRADDVTEAASENVIYSIQISRIGKSLGNRPASAPERIPAQSQPAQPPAQPPTNSVTNPVGSIVNQNSPNYGQQLVNNGPPVRHLNDQQTTTLKTATAALPDAVIRVGHVDDVEAGQLAKEIRDALGSKLDPMGILGVPGEWVQMGKFAGISVGADFNDTNHLYVDYARSLVTVMKMGGFPDAFLDAEKIQVPISGWNARVWICVGTPPLP